MDNHFAKNESNKNNKQNANEASTAAEEREDRGKKYNAYVQLMTGQKNHQLLTILMDACSGT